MSRPRTGSNLNYAVNTTDTTILAGNPHRRFLFVSNPTANAIFIALGRTAVANQDFEVPANSVMRPLHYDDIGELLTSELHAITVTTAGFIAVFEGFAHYESPPAGLVANPIGKMSS